MADERYEYTRRVPIRPDYESYWWWRGFWCCLVLNWAILLGCYFDILPALWRALWGIQP